MHELDEAVSKLRNFFNLYRHEVVLDGQVNLHDLVFDGHRLILRLDEELHRPFAGVDLGFRALIEVGAELGESGQFAVLGQAQAEGTGDFLHGLDLGGAADTGNGEADVDSRADPGVEGFCFQEDLAVCDGNDVSRDIGRQVTGQGFDDRQGRNRAAAEFIGQLGSAFEETGM